MKLLHILKISALITLVISVLFVLLYATQKDFQEMKERSQQQKQEEPKQKLKIQVQRTFTESERPDQKYNQYIE